MDKAALHTHGTSWVELPFASISIHWGMQPFTQIRLHGRIPSLILSSIPCIPVSASWTIVIPTLSDNIDGGNLKTIVLHGQLLTLPPIRFHGDLPHAYLREKLGTSNCTTIHIQPLRKYFRHYFSGLIRTVTLYHHRHLSFRTDLPVCKALYHDRHLHFYTDLNFKLNWILT